MNISHPVNMNTKQMSALKTKCTRIHAKNAEIVRSSLFMYYLNGFFFGHHFLKPMGLRAGAFNLAQYCGWENENGPSAARNGSRGLMTRLYGAIKEQISHIPIRNSRLELQSS